MGKSRFTYEFVKGFVEEKGYNLLSDEYVNSFIKLKLRCPLGHVFFVSFGNFRHGGTRCPECYGSKKYTLDFIREYAEKEGYILVSDKYTSVKNKLCFLCPNGHTYNVCWEKFYRRGYRCSVCSGKGGLSIDIARQRFKETGYTLLEDAYVDCVTPMKFKCTVGHIHYMNLNNLTRGQRCGLCFNELDKGRKSYKEDELFYHYEGMGLQIIRNDRDLIGPYELDLYFPSEKVAIEYCGLYWHSDELKVDRAYHYNKMKVCEEKGVRLITIFEDEYLEKPDIVLSRIDTALGLVKDRIYARKCQLMDVSLIQARKFFESTHIQGPGVFRKAFGLFYNGKLVSAMAVGLPIRKYKDSTRVPLELKRFSSLLGVVVVGGASKLFKEVKKYASLYGFTEVKSYCDMRYGTPFFSVYKRLGFEEKSFTKYTPHYFKGQKRYRNFSLRKTQEERLSGKTECELREAQGYRRLWDCGHKVYVYNI